MKNNQIQQSEIKTQADAALYFLQRMDIEMLDDILEDNRTYQDFEKGVFLNKLSEAFNEFKGDTFLNCYRGSCNSELCNYKCTGFSFVGNVSNNFMDLIIDVKEGIVVDIYECIDFKNIRYGIEKKKRIKINN